jgi:hypothetical protein
MAHVKGTGDKFRDKDGENAGTTSQRRILWPCGRLLPRDVATAAGAGSRR